jgi:hypothetical protein
MTEGEIPKTFKIFHPHSPSLSFIQIAVHILIYFRKLFSFVVEISKQGNLPQVNRVHEDEV